MAPLEVITVPDSFFRACDMQQARLVSVLHQKRLVPQHAARSGAAAKQREPARATMKVFTTAALPGLHPPAHTVLKGKGSAGPP